MSPFQPQGSSLGLGDFPAIDWTKPSAFTGETLMRSGTINDNAAGAAVGNPLLTLIGLKGGTTITTLSGFTAATAVGVPTNQWFGVWDVNRNTLRLTADDLAAAWPGRTLKTLTLSTPLVIPSTGYYYFGVLIAATTAPTWYGAHTGINTSLDALAPIVCGTSATGGLTTPASCPATIGALTALTTGPFWMGYA